MRQHIPKLHSGVGYGICQRLLLQLCRSIPPDSRPQGFASDITAGESKQARYTGVTLIMACRNMKRADAARTNLLRWFDSELHKILLDEEDETYVRTFREACDVQIAELDLASFASVVKFAAGIQQKYVNFVFYPRLLSY